MAKIKKRGQAGNAKNYITRTQAVRKLQISLPDFRRLCIFKGIYPREPRNKKKAKKGSTPSTTFYYTRDIQYLLHEPLLAKFREHKAVAKKIGRYLGRGEVSDAARLEKNLTPRMTLDHIIKERYPTFVDALRDLDDALSMLFLFANLPSTATIPPKTIALCQRLCLEFEHYLIVTHSLRRSFLSIKGIYYQATIQGQDILWLVPYKFVQNTSGDIDFRIMGTFIECYTTLLGFVNFRLYTSIGLVYPPKFNQSSDDRGGELGAFTLEGKTIDTQKAIEAPATNGTNATSAAAQAAADKVSALALSETEAETTTHERTPTDLVTSEAIDTFEATGADADVLPQPQASSDEAGKLFAPFTFFLSRETPRQPLEFLLKAFGCKRVGWSEVLGDGAFTTSETDPLITHQIVDRPNLPADSFPPVPEASEENSDSTVSKTLRPGARVPGRTYVQPQWVWDCVNQGKLLRPDLYAPGATLPPHLSPWVKPKKGEYDPTAPLEEQEREGEADEVDDLEDEGGDEDDESDEEVDDKANSNLLLEDSVNVEAGEGMHIAGSDSEDGVDDGADQVDDEWGGISEDEAQEVDEEEARKIQEQRELEAEAKGLPFNKKPAEALEKERREQAKKKAKKRQKEVEEELERQKMMMPRKKRKLLNKMMYSNAKKDEEAETLRARRRKLEKSGKRT